MSNLFHELKRRKVFQVAAGYSVVAWLVVQVADTIAPMMNLSESAPRLVLFLLLLFFPIALFLAWAYEISPDITLSKSGSLAHQPATSAIDRKLIYATFGLVLLVAGFQIADRFGRNSPELVSESERIVSPTRDFFINLGETAITATHADIAVSPDGSKLVYKIQRPDLETRREIWLREFDPIESRLLATGTIHSPFFSPDGEWIAYIDNRNRELYKLSIQSGNSQLLASDVASGTGGYWHTDDYIYLPSGDQTPPRLIRVSADGSQRESLNTVIEDGTAAHVWPHPLPDNESLLFSINYFQALVTDIGLLTLQTAEVRTLISNGYYARYVPTGHIVFMRDSDLWAVPFDLNSKEIEGKEVPIVQGVEANSRNGRAAYAFSSDGTLFYVPGEDYTPGRRLPPTSPFGELVWVDRDGREQQIPIEIQGTSQPESSPGGQRLALSLGGEIWIYDLERDLLSQLTFDEVSEIYPIWSPDGTRVAFLKSREGGELWWRASDGTGEEELLVSASGAPIRPNAFTPDGTQLVYESDGDLFLLTIGSNEPGRLLLGTEFVEARASISPDGRWIAYESNESGEYRIYVHPFPNVGDGKWQISNTGGIWPKWNGEGDALYYRGVSPNFSTVWEVKLDTTNDRSQFQYEAPTQLFSGNYTPELERGGGSAFDVSSDGQRFLLPRMAEMSPSTNYSENTQIAVIPNWFEDLNRLAPRD